VTFELIKKLYVLTIACNYTELRIKCGLRHFDVDLSFNGPRF